MGADGAADIIFRNEPADLKQQKKDEYVAEVATPYQAAKHAMVEQVIEPKTTRPVIISALKMLKNKKEDRPYKKHGNIPL